MLEGQGCELRIGDEIAPHSRREEQMPQDRLMAGPRLERDDPGAACQLIEPSEGILDRQRFFEDPRGTKLTPRARGVHRVKF